MKDKEIFAMNAFVLEESARLLIENFFGCYPVEMQVLVLKNIIKKLEEGKPSARNLYKQKEK